MSNIAGSGVRLPTLQQALFLTCCLATAKLLNTTKPQCPHLQNGYKNTTKFIEWLGLWQEIKLGHLYLKLWSLPISCLRVMPSVVLIYISLPEAFFEVVEDCSSESLRNSWQRSVSTIMTEGNWYVNISTPSPSGMIIRATCSIKLSSIFLQD